MVEWAQKINRDRAAMTMGIRKRLFMETVGQKKYTRSPVQMPLW